MSEQAGKDEQLRAYLAEHDEPCPNCGYNLHGLSGTYCPECHQQLVLSVNLVEPRTALLLTTVIGLTFGTAPSIGIVLLCAVMTLTQGPPPRNYVGWLFMYPSACALLMGMLTIRQCSRKGRRYFRGITNGRARALAIGAWCVSLLLIVIFMVGAARM